MHSHRAIHLVTSPLRRMRPLTSPKRSRQVILTESPRFLRPFYRPHRHRIISPRIARYLLNNYSLKLTTISRRRLQQMPRNLAFIINNPTKTRLGIHNLNPLHRVANRTPASRLNRANRVILSNSPPSNRAPMIKFTQRSILRSSRKYSSITTLRVQSVRALSTR